MSERNLAAAFRQVAQAMSHFGAAAAEAMRETAREINRAMSARLAPRVEQADDTAIITAIRSYLPRHGTPSSFAEVCGDDAVARIKTPCDCCRNYDDNPYLSCAMHPLGRPGAVCPDWEDANSKAAQRARFDAEQLRRQAEFEAAERQRERWRERMEALGAIWPTQMPDWED